MSFLDSIFGTDPTTSEGRMANELVGAYNRHRLLDRGLDGAISWATGEDDLEDEDMRLNIMMKRRALGLPMDSDDLDRANNGDTPFLTQMTTLAGTRALQQIPSPGLLQGTAEAASHVRLPWEASNIGRGALGALSAIGGKYVSPLGRFFR